MHPWHDTYVDDSVIATGFPVIVEIPKGSTNKYELDKETGLLRRDPLDALVLGQEPVYPLTIVQARAVGVMRMRDDKGVDDKIVAVSVRDPSFEGYTDKGQLPAHVLRQVQRFFQDYKVLEHKQVVIEDLLGPEDALRIIRESLELYRQLRRGELK
jgi:inorganic pyrophosphatase